VLRQPSAIPSQISSCTSRDLEIARPAAPQLGSGIRCGSSGHLEHEHEHESKPEPKPKPEPEPEPARARARSPSCVLESEHQSPAPYQSIHPSLHPVTCTSPQLGTSDSSASLQHSSSSQQPHSRSRSRGRAVLRPRSYPRHSAAAAEAVAAATAAAVAAAGIRDASTSPCKELSSD
jgi:hypothetical protein